MVSELLRQALTATRDLSATRPSVVHEAPAVYGLQPFARRGAIVTNELIDQLRQDDAF